MRNYQLYIDEDEECVKMYNCCYNIVRENDGHTYLNLSEYWEYRLVFLIKNKNINYSEYLAELDKKNISYYKHLIYNTFELEYVLPLLVKQFNYFEVDKPLDVTFYSDGRTKINSN